MAIPRDAVLEAVVSPRVVLYDVSELLPIHRRRRPETRDPAGIEVLRVHKSGGNGPAGYRGLWSSGRYVVQERNFPCEAYTFWLSKVADRDAEGRIVVYRGVRDHIRSWHTGGVQNVVGIALGFQGTFDGDWSRDLTRYGEPRIKTRLTADQLVGWEDFVPWVLEHYSIDPSARTEHGWGLGGHWEHGKPVCPGDHLRSLIVAYRGETAPSELEAPPEIAAAAAAVPEWLRGTRALQRGLTLLEHRPGPIDGIMGLRTRAALERFQAVSSLQVDGVYGPKSAAALERELAGRGITSGEDLRHAAEGDPAPAPVPVDPEPDTHGAVDDEPADVIARVSWDGGRPGSREITTVDELVVLQALTAECPTGCKALDVEPLACTLAWVGCYVDFVSRPGSLGARKYPTLGRLVEGHSQPRNPKWRRGGEYCDGDGEDDRGRPELGRGDPCAPHRLDRREAVVRLTREGVGRLYPGLGELVRAILTGARPIPPQLRGIIDFRQRTNHFRGDIDIDFLAGRRLGNAFELAPPGRRRRVADSIRLEAA